MFVNMRVFTLRLASFVATGAIVSSLLMDCASSSHGGFDPREASTVPVITQRRVITQALPICMVIHTDGDQWFFLSNAASDLPDPSITTTLDVVLKLDPTIVQLATLPRGWRADRNTAADPWIRSELKQGKTDQ